MSEDIYVELSDEEVKKQRWREQNKLYRERNKQQVKDKRKLYRESNREFIAEQNKKYYHTHLKYRLRRRPYTHTASRALYEKQRYADNREHILARNLKYRTDNRSKFSQYARLYAGQAARAQPLWANQEAMDVIYKKRDELNALWGTNFEVDHIVPLRGKTVCGLHCEDNLQLLDKPLNASKNRYTWTDMP